MHVVLNAQLISREYSYRSAGVSTYSRHLLTALGDKIASEPEVRLTALSNAFAPGVTSVIGGVDLQASRLPLHKPPARIAWEQLALPRLLKKLNADVVHGLVNVLPLATDVPGVVTVHDLSFLRLPQHFKPSKRIYLSLMCRASVQKAAAVIAVSKQTAYDVVQHLGAPVSRVHVVYNGVDSSFTPGDEVDVEGYRRAKGLPNKYFLFVGTLEPRKNLETLLAAYARYRSRSGAHDDHIKLVVAGGKGWYYETIFAHCVKLELTDDVIFTGYVADAELPNLYRAAVGFVYPSVFEGFGLPALEAMACGTPVLCSDLPALREVVEHAAIPVQPYDVDGWAHGLALLAEQPRLRRVLAERGLQRARNFSWSLTASKTLAVYRDLERKCASRR